MSDDLTIDDEVLGVLPWAGADRGVEIVVVPGGRAGWAWLRFRAQEATSAEPAGWAPEATWYRAELPLPSARFEAAWARLEPDRPMAAWNYASELANLLSQELAVGLADRESIGTRDGEQMLVLEKYGFREADLAEHWRRTRAREADGDEPERNV